MTAIDWVIVVLSLAYAYIGWQRGAVASLLSLVGFVLGTVLGLRFAAPFAERIAHGTAQVPAAIAAVIFCALTAQWLGSLLGVRLRARFTYPGARNVDRGFGAVFGALAVPIVAWMLAVPLASSPYPKLASAATSSRIVRAVNDAMPSSARHLYASMRSFVDRSGFPPVLGDLPTTPITEVAPPAPASAAVLAMSRRVQNSVVKIHAQAPSCGRAIEGSGFVYAPQRVLTNAHVVAGTDAVQLESGSRSYRATVVVYDPERDVAVLSVPGLNAAPLPLASSVARAGDPAVVLGYPEDGGYTVNTARVRARFDINGNDIYNRPGVTREVYSIRALVRSGNSGGPLVTNSGEVYGVVFAAATNSADTGYVLTNEEVAPDAAAGRTATAAVGTQSCAAA